MRSEPPGTKPTTGSFRTVSHRIFGCFTLIAGAILAVACAHHEGGPRNGRPPSLFAPEAHSDHGMVSSGSVEATRAGVQILERGGNAVDAAVAAAFALGVADPGGSGLGGMTYILISLPNGRAIAIDGSAIVPLAADAATLLQLRDAGEHMKGRAVAVPATLAALDHALARYGTMRLEEVLQPSIEIADRGFRLSSNTVAWTTGYFDEILASRYLRFVVLDGGDRAGSVGDIVCRPDLATTLRRLAEEGANSFYRGEMAHTIGQDLRSLGGYIQPVDLARVRARELQPLRSKYRGADIISYPWPGGGGEVAESLNILQTFSREFLAEDSVNRLHVMIEAFRIAHTDHLHYGHNPAQQAVGANDYYLSEEHARERASLIIPGRAIPDEVLGVAGPGPRMGEHTTHLSVIDRNGTAVALSQTLCRQYGAKVATPGLGFPYNSCLEFFDFENPGSPYYLSPRAPYATTMAPTIVRRDGQVMILGSAGSDRISPSVVEVISKVIDRDMGIRDAVVAPRVLWNSAHDPERICIEITDPITKKDADRLQTFGFDHMFRLHFPPVPREDLAFFGGVNAAFYDSATGVFSGVGDPRRSGYALGPRAVTKPKENP
jgi:gamma-glutamyltranspeptidase/glutathione hydrolase